MNGFFNKGLLIKHIPLFIHYFRHQIINWRIPCTGQTIRFYKIIYNNLVLWRYRKNLGRMLVSSFPSEKMSNQYQWVAVLSILNKEFSENILSNELNSIAIKIARNVVTWWCASVGKREYCVKYFNRYSSEILYF